MPGTQAQVDRHAAQDTIKRSDNALQILRHRFLDYQMTHHGSLVTYPVAFLSIISPWWLPMLEHFSQSCALVLPIIGVGWLIIQVCWGVWDRRKK